MTHKAKNISAALAGHADLLVRELLPNGSNQSGYWRVGNLDGAKGSSLAIQVVGSKQGLWIDHATGEKGDALDLVKGVLNCTTRDAIEWSEKLLARNGAPPRAQAPRASGSDDVTDRIERALTIWEQAVDPRDTVAGIYLRGRALQLTGALANRVIRFDPASPWRDDAAGKTIRVPAMIVAMRSIDTDKITAIQRTRLSPEGKKVERRMLGVAAGAAVKLDADRLVTNRLHIGEGVESCMSAQEMGFRPTWAVGSAGAIAASRYWTESTR